MKTHIPNRKHDLLIPVTVATENTTLEAVECRIYLPQHEVEEAVLVLSPSEGQSGALKNAWKVALSGTLPNWEGGTGLRLRADTVYNEGTHQQYWGKRITECWILCRAEDLTIIRPLNRTGEQTQAIFRMTPSPLLGAGKFFTFSFDGRIEAHEGTRLSCQLTGGPNISFDTHYRYVNKDNGQVTRVPYVVIQLETALRAEDVAGFKETLLPSIDTVMRLLSFAQRVRSHCVGWHACDGDNDVDFYRGWGGEYRDYDPSRHSDMLLDQPHWTTFIAKGYDVLKHIDANSLVADAIAYVVPREGDTFQAGFLRNFTALEKLTTHFRQTRSLVDILAPDDWEKFKEAIQEKSRTWLKEKTELDSKRRALLYDKISELNRVSFGAAFSLMCEAYNVDLRDLWPVSGSKIPSLASIRNKLIHGETIPDEHYDIILYAGDHLKWIVERLVLSLLGWPVSDSNADGKHLKNMIGYTELQRLMSQLGSSWS